MEPISTVIPEITIRHGRAVTTSTAVANFFGKQHKHVLEKIRTLECSPAFMTANFSAVVVTVKAGFNERETEAYEMTKDGFTFLVMGFTGKRAACFKEAYIAEFNRMESELNSTGMINCSLDVDVLLRVRGGSVVSTQIAREGQHLMSFEEFKHTAARAGYLVIHHTEVFNMTLDGLMQLANQQNRIA